MERNKQTYRKTDRQEDMHPDTPRRIGEIKRQTDRLSKLREINTHTHTHKQRDRQAGRQADRQADRQAGRQADK
jgi:hypothetical protein